MIGGYFSREHRLADDAIRERLRVFSIVPGDAPDDYENVVIPFEFGHVVAKYKPAACKQVSRHGENGCSLLTLGFQDPSADQLVSRTHGPRTGRESAPEEAAQAIETAEGEFVSILLEHDRPRVHIVNDRFASRPFYLLKCDRGVYFSSNLLFLLRLAGGRHRPDVLGWLQIFSYGHTLGTRTNLESVERLMPGTHAEIDTEGITRRRYWRLTHHPDDGLDAVEHAERTWAAFRAGAERRARLADRGFVSLSGGLDSRLAAAAIPPDADYFAFTIDNSTADAATEEVAVARQVSERLRRPHRVVQIAPEEISRIAEPLMQLTAGMTIMHHPAKSFQALRQMIAGSGFKMGGGPGDVLAGGYVLPSIHSIHPPMTGALVRRFIIGRRRHGRDVLEGLFARDALAEHFPMLEASMEECFAEISGPTAAHRITAWAMVYRQPAFTFSGPIHNHPDVTEASPHLGYAYADCMLRLPAGWLYRKNFYTFMIYHCLPQLRDIIYANTGKLLPGHLQNYHVSPRKRVCGAIERCLPAMFVLPFGRRRAAPFRATFEYELLRSQVKLFHDVTEILRSSAGLRDLLDVEGCCRFVGDFRQQRLHTTAPVNEVELMGAVATLCYWHHTFYDVLAV